MFNWIFIYYIIIYSKSIYAGPSADSETEVKAIEKTILDSKNEWDAYVALHTYAQLCMFYFFVLYL